MAGHVAGDTHVRWSACWREASSSGCTFGSEASHWEALRKQAMRRWEKQLGKRAAGQERVGNGLGSTKDVLGAKLIPEWHRRPASYKRDFHHFARNVTLLAGGEQSPQEAEEACMLVWDILHDATESSHGNPLEIIKETLHGIFGTVDETAMEEAIRLGVQLKTHDETSAHRKESEGSKSSVESGREFGEDLEFTPPPAQPRKMLQIPSQTFPSQNNGPHTSHRAMQQEAAPEPMPNFDVERKNEATGVQWLSDQCHKICPGEDGTSLTLGVCRILLGSLGPERTAAELFDLLGDRGFELISSIMQHQSSITEDIDHRIARLKDGLNSKKEAAVPSFGQQVTVTSDYEKQMERLHRKGTKKAGKKAAAEGGSPIDFICSIGLPAFLEASTDFRKESEDVSFPFDTKNPFTKRGLPQGTTRSYQKGYEEVRVPPPPSKPLDVSERLVPIGDLPDYAQVAFAGFDHLNRIQSKILQAGMLTNQNLLVCAPTGAGKTNIAMITILREIGQHIQNGIIQLSAFKIVYVAPMKALAAEMTSSFGKRLQKLGICVREFTGDMQLSKKELAETQMIVTTPEKWDVITRKGGDVAIAGLVTLLIIDEVHLLNDDRGPVIETLVARTLRQVEASQSLIRIVGLSATLPNYKDVAKFLNVNEESGLFHFDASYRPIPLHSQFIGVSEPNVFVRNTKMNEICYEKVIDAVRRGKQVMVFVHARKETSKTARALIQLAQTRDEAVLFDPAEHSLHSLYEREVSKSRNREVQELFSAGFGVHHAGMLRADRNLSEKMFSAGILKVLVCTATLAWGVNLPAHTVVIKGTQVYDAQRGRFCDLGVLDVQQIFGRAGRPQFDTSGEGIIITTHEKLNHYLSLLTHQLPIESQFTSLLKDCLNAEITLGTVTNVKEGVKWLGYTYLFVRMQRNPLAYGVSWSEVQFDPFLESKRRSLIVDAANALHQCQMARFDEGSGNIYITELGRVASHFYLKSSSIEVYNKLLKPHMTESDLFGMIALSSEFENVAVRSDEVMELEKLKKKYCPIPLRGGIESRQGKVCVLLQTYVSRGYIEGFSLVADLMYISQNAGRLFRAIFEICSKRGWPSLAELVLMYAIAVERTVWPFQHPLRQFENMLKPEILTKLEERRLFPEQLEYMGADEVGAMLRLPQAGEKIKRIYSWLPAMDLDGQVQPITHSVLRITLSMQPKFFWSEKAHGSAVRWIIWVEDTENEHIYHLEQWILQKKALQQAPFQLSFTIPLADPRPSQYLVRCMAADWLCPASTFALPFDQLVLPQECPPHTELLHLNPLPRSALQNSTYERMYEHKFSSFNPIQTQVFFPLYHMDVNVLLGAPTGSGKTVSCELAMLRLFRLSPEKKVVYIAPLKALVRERMAEWGNGLCKFLNKKLVELTGDYTPDIRALQTADVIICTPEKWDGISRSWQSRSYVRQVGLIVMDEIHLLGADRGPTLEVIVSRTNYIGSKTKEPVRIVGLSTALANADDLGKWLGIHGIGVFNFKPSVRPIPMEVHIQGYAGKYYCPRMAAMNKPCYAAIQTHSPGKPVIVFVSSRRQTRLTALDLAAFAVADEKPRAFTRLSEEELEHHISRVTDGNLKHTLYFGIGLHHAGLPDGDRKVVEELFLAGKIQILIATSTLAWGVNFPAHLVIVKGTEYFDAPGKQYVDYPITDILQMMGRAGRPQFDVVGKAVVMVHESKKEFYKKFLYEPFPVESSLLQQLHDHLNAEVVSGSIVNQQGAVDYLTWTFFYRRLTKNPSYYGLSGTSHAEVKAFLEEKVQRTLSDLGEAGCIQFEPETGDVSPLTLGKIASFYYLSYQTASHFSGNLLPGLDEDRLLGVLSGAAEFSELPVRHNEDGLNAGLAGEVRVHVDPKTLDDPHTKANLLFQAHFGRVQLPISDYVTDTKSCLDQSMRIVQAMIEFSADCKWLDTLLACMGLQQMLMQGLWHDQNSLLVLPHVSSSFVLGMQEKSVADLRSLLVLLQEKPSKFRKYLSRFAPHASACSEVEKAVGALPLLQARCQFTRSSTREEDSALNGEQDGDWYDMTLELRVENRKKCKGVPMAQAPRFPKSKEEGWWVVVGHAQTKELLAHQRVSFASHKQLHMQVDARTASFRTFSERVVHVWIVSDCYLGLDVHLSASLSN